VFVLSHVPLHDNSSAALDAILYDEIYTEINNGRFRGDWSRLTRLDLLGVVKDSCEKYWILAVV